MVGILSAGSRGLSRPLFRRAKHYLDNKLLAEAHITERNCHKLAPAVLNSTCRKASTFTITRFKNPISNDYKHRHFVRNFRTSTSLFESRVVNAPEFPDSVSEGDLKWHIQPGTHVAEDDTVAEIETDKTAIVVPAPAHAPLFKFTVTGEKPVDAPKASVPPPQAPSEPAPESRPPPPPPPPPPTQTAATPSPPPPSAAPPTPSAIPKSSIPVAAIRHAYALETATVKVPPKDPTKEIAGTRSEHRVKMNRMRLKIAERLKMAQNTNACLTTFNEIDMSYIMEFRKANQDAFQKKYKIKLGFMSAFAKASAFALQDQPIVNGVIDDKTQEIIYRDYVDISVAVATPKGLVVPVLRNVQAMNYADIELELTALGKKSQRRQNDYRGYGRRYFYYK